MDRLFGEKSKKSLESSHTHTSLGMPTNAASGSFGFRTELDIDPKYENDTRASRITLRDNRSEDRGLPSTPEPSTIGAVGDKHRNGPTKGISRDTNKEEGKRAGASRVPERDRNDRVLGTAAILVKVTRERPDVTKELPDGFSALKAVLGAISIGFADDEGAVAARYVEGLISRIAALEALFSKPPCDVEEQRSRNELIRRFECIGGLLQHLSEKLGLKPPAERVQDEEEVFGLLEDLRETINDYKAMQQTTTDEQGCRLMNSAEAAVLNSIRCAHMAEYRHGNRKGCLKGTRRAVLNEIEFWTSDFDKPPVYWLNGLAGTGKSTIAQTVAERAFADGRLGASFFCSRDFSDRRDLHLIFPTLAVQLARRYNQFRSIFIPLVQSDPEIAYESLYNQMNKLIAQPLRQSSISTVIVIDALDECKDEEPASAILSVLGQFVSTIPKVKFFVTGRPEPRIREGFRLPLLAEATDVFVLHNVERSLVDNDIRLFLRQSFLELTHRRRGLDGWPTDEQLNLLCERAAGLFVYATATVKFIDHRNNNPKTQLGRLLQSPQCSSREGKTEFRADITLDSLYMSILQGAFGRDDPEDDPKVRSILGAVVLPTDPLSPFTIATLLGLDPEDVFLPLSSIHSLLLLQEDIHHPVRPFHKSFPDFIMNPTRCTNPRFHIPPPNHHLQLLVGCFDLMNRTLEINMCKLPDAVANSDVSDLKERVKRCIDPALQYVCRSWHTHLVDADTTPARSPAITSALHQFLEKKFLFWLEVLSVLGTVRNAVVALQVTADWLEESPTLDLANDCSRFVTGYFDIISASTPHIYHSALVFTPKTSIVRKSYESYARPFVRAVDGVQLFWDQNTATKTCPSAIELAMWSQCGRLIAITLRGSVMVDILDSATLQRLQTLESPQGIPSLHRGLAFSPDSRVFTCCSGGSEDGYDEDGGLSVVSWDLQTGGIISVIKHQGPGVHITRNPPFTYSMNGKVVGVSHSYYRDPMISFFDIISGVHTHSHSLAISGARTHPHPLVSLFEDEYRYGRLLDDIWTYEESIRLVTVGRSQFTVTIWEVGFASGATLTEVKTFCLPLPYMDVRQVRHLPTSCRFAVACPGGVLVWDARNFKSLLSHSYKGPTRGYRSTPPVSFSSDGCFFACSITGSEIYLWKESPTGYILHETLASSANYPKLLFSPNGKSIVAFGDRTIQLWHTKGSTTPFTILTRGNAEFVLDFSPDGALAVTARKEDDMVKIIDLKSGVPQLIIDAGMKVYGLRFIGNTVAAIGDSELITWNLPARDRAPNASMNIRDCSRTRNFRYWRDGHIFTASISPDLHHVAITTTEMGILRLYVYSASTGEYLGRTMPNGAASWFTPDGHGIWCAAGSGEAEVWTITGCGNPRPSLVRETSVAGVKDPPEGYPWGSSRGYQTTDDGWVLSPNGKRLLMLPPAWQSYPVLRVWNGRFLALLHGALLDPVILEIDS